MIKCKSSIKIFRTYAHTMVTEVTGQLVIRLSTTNRQEIAMNWRRREGKLEAIRRQWGVEVPDYLWFHAGPRMEPAMLEAAKSLFKKSPSCFGDIEWHQTTTPAIAGDFVLRVRQASELVLAIECGGKEFPLYLVGYTDDPRRIDFTE